MSELGREARDFLASARGAHDASAGAKDRVRVGLAAALSMSATAGAGGAVATAPAGVRSAWLTGAKMATVIAVVGGGAWLLLGHAGSKTSAQASLARGVVVDPVLAPPPPPPALSTASPVAIEPTREGSLIELPAPSSSAVTAPPARPPVAAVPRQPSPQAAEGSVAAEVAILQRVSAALRRGDPDRALVAIAEHARRFPNGALAEERDTERIVALCALGRSEEAARARGRFERAYPASPHEARVQAACARPGAQP